MCFKIDTLWKFQRRREWIYREKSLETTLWVVSNRDYVDEQVFSAAETGLFCMNAGKPVLWKQRLRLLSKWFRDNATLLCVSIPRANFKCKLPLVGYKNQLLRAFRMKILICAPGHLGWQKSVDSIRTPLGLVHCLIPDDEHLNLGVPNLINAPVHFCGELSDPSVGQGCARGNGTFEMELHSLALRKWQSQTPNGAYHTQRLFTRDFYKSLWKQGIRKPTVTSFLSLEVTDILGVIFTVLFFLSFLHLHVSDRLLSDRKDCPHLAVCLRKVSEGLSCVRWEKAERGGDSQTGYVSS